MSQKKYSEPFIKSTMIEIKIFKVWGLKPSNSDSEKSKCKFVSIRQKRQSRLSNISNCQNFSETKIL